ncbi:MAG TPA: hypothetical protein VI072_30875 [Polyangiaceae bacterium]
MHSPGTNPSCQWDVSLCGRGVCGDGKIEVLEACDGPNLKGLTCGNFAFGYTLLGTPAYMIGTLRCDGGCAFDTSGCRPPPGCYLIALGSRLMQPICY